MITPGQLWYGQHFICYRQLFKKTTTQAVFEYVVDEYTKKAKGDGICYFELKRNDIRVKLGMAWGTIQEHLALLRKMGIIDYVGGEDWECTVCETRLISLLCTIADNKTEALKRKFKDALESGNEEQLTKLGYHFHPEYEGMLKKLSGSPFRAKLEKNDNLIKNFTSLSNNSQSCEKSNKVIRNVRSLSDFSQGYQISDKFWSKCDRMANDIASKICQNISKKSLSYQISDKFSQIFDNAEDLNRFLDDLYSGEQMAFSPILFLLAGEIGCLGQNLLKISQGDYQIFESLNNRREVTSLSSEEEIEDNQEKEDKWENDSFSGGSSDEQEFPAIKFNEESYRLSKKKSSLPYFTRKEISIFQQSPDLCVDRADKIFIYCLWDNLVNHLFQDIEDEDGNITTKTVDPEGEYILMDDMYKNILLPAFERTNDMIALGKLDCEKGVFEITTQEPLDPDTVDLIVDFDIKETSEGRYYVIDSGKFCDTHATPTQVFKKPEGMRTSEYNRRYTQEIIRMGDDDSQYEKLTTIELFVYNFLNEFYEINDDLEVVDVNEEHRSHPFLNQSALKTYFIQHPEITMEDFLSITKAGKVDQDGAITLELRMFPADKVQGWNEKHKEQSEIVIE